MKNFKTILIVCVLCASSLSAEARPELSKDQIKRLSNGEVLDFSIDSEGTSIKTGKALGVFQDIPEAVLYVLMGIDKYKHFLPRVKESRITKYRDNYTYAVLETSLPWPFKDGWAYIKVARTDKPGRVFEINWRMVNGTMANYAGSAIIEPWDKDSKKTLLTYKFLAVPKISAPDSSISKGVRKAAATIIHKLRMRLTALRKYKKMPKGF